MDSFETVSKAGYLAENYRYFHLRDTAGAEANFHFHEFCKIVILLSGRVDYTVESITYPLKSWDILLVNDHTIHRAVIDKSQVYERVILYLDRDFADRVLPERELMSCFTRSDSAGRHLLVPDAAQRKALSAWMLEYESLRQDTQFGAHALEDLCILKLLVLLGRIRTPGEQGSDTHDPKIAQVLAYMDAHLSEDLSVEKLAELVFLSKYHFMRLFKADTGSTVHALLRQKRLLHASRLIRAGVPAVQAAQASGFGDYSAFHRAFRDTFGTSPGALKQ